MSAAVRSTALRAGGACVRCRKGKTKCVYENGRAPCKNCAKGLHECYLPSESMSHGGHGVSPARIHQARVRESLPSERAVSGVTGDRQGVPASSVSRHVSSTTEKYVSRPFLGSSCFFPICVGWSCYGFTQYGVAPELFRFRVTDIVIFPFGSGFSVASLPRWLLCRWSPRSPSPAPSTRRSWLACIF